VIFIGSVLWHNRWRWKLKAVNKKVIWLVTLFLLAIGTFLEAQQAGKIARIGFLDTGTASGMAVLLDAFRQEMGKLGWVEGKNIIIEYRFGESKGPAHVRELVADLVRLKVDLIVVSGTPTALAAKKRLLPFPL